MDTYRLSQHALFRTDGGGILFGSEFGSIFSVPGQVCDLIEDLSVGGEAVDFEGADAERLSALEELRSLGVLMPTGRAAPKPAALDPEGIDLETLVLETAQACNMRCAYCYAEGGSYGGAPAMLEPEAAAKAARYLVANSGKSKALTLVLFGGEPLLNFPAVKKAVEEARKSAQEAGKTLTLSITTNGTRFTQEIVDFLAENRVVVSVSIDGPQDLHDANRKYALGGGTYGDIVKGLETLKIRGIPVGARVTLTPSQWGRIPEVFEHLAGLGFIEVGIAPASPVSTGMVHSEEEEDALLAGFAALAERFLSEARNGRTLPFANLLDLLGRLHKGRVKAVPCGAGYGYFAVDASERLFLCHRLSGEAEFEVGSLAAGIDYGRLRKTLDQASSSRDGMCGECWARPLCAGGCHYENHQREKKLGAEPGGMCGFIRRWLELGIRVYAKLCEMEDSTVLDRLSGRGEC